MHPSIYQPSDDSHLFADFLNKKISKLSTSKKQKLTLLDMGTGSGILAKTAIKSGLKNENIFAIDINPKAVRELKKQGLNSLKSDLFKNPKLKNKNFDMITFNAPYLPEDKREPKDSQLATTGGKRGDEITLKFLKQAKKHLNEKGKIYLLISSLTPQEKIKEQIKESKGKIKKVVSKKLFMEELFIFEILF